MNDLVQQHKKTSETLTCWFILYFTIVWSTLNVPQELHVMSKKNKKNKKEGPHLTQFSVFKWFPSVLVMNVDILLQTVHNLSQQAMELQLTFSAKLCTFLSLLITVHCLESCLSSRPLLLHISQLSDSILVCKRSPAHYRKQSRGCQHA